MSNHLKNLYFYFSKIAKYSSTRFLLKLYEIITAAKTSHQQKELICIPRHQRKEGINRL